MQYLAPVVPANIPVYTLPAGQGNAAVTGTSAVTQYQAVLQPTGAVVPSPAVTQYQAAAVQPNVALVQQQPPAVIQYQAPVVTPHLQVAATQPVTQYAAQVIPISGQVSAAPAIQQIVPAGLQPAATPSGVIQHIITAAVPTPPSISTAAIAGSTATITTPAIVVPVMSSTVAPQGGLQPTASANIVNPPSPEDSPMDTTPADAATVDPYPFPYPSWRVTYQSSTTATTSDQTSGSQQNVGHPAIPVTATAPTSHVATSAPASAPVPSTSGNIQVPATNTQSNVQGPPVVASGAGVGVTAGPSTSATTSDKNIEQKIQAIVDAIFGRQ